MTEWLDHSSGWALRITDSGLTDRETIARVLHVPVELITEIPAHGRATLRYFDVMPPEELSLPEGTENRFPRKTRRAAAEHYWAVCIMSRVSGCFINVVVTTKKRLEDNYRYFRGLEASQSGRPPIYRTRKLVKAAGASE